MSDSDHDESDSGEFVFQDSMTIINNKAKLHATITAKFLCTIDGNRFIHMDQYQSRGVYNLMTCKIDVEDGSKPKTVSATSFATRKKVVRDFCNDLRAKRDRAFRDAVLQHGPDPNLKFVGVVVPKNKRLKISVLQHDSTIDVVMEAIDGVAEECSIKCKAPSSRNNGNSELWICVDGRAFDYIANVVANNYRAQLHALDSVIGETSVDSLHIDDCDNRPTPVPVEPSSAEAGASVCDSHEQLILTPPPIKKFATLNEYFQVKQR